jgi:hypothetical protein
MGTPAWCEETALKIVRAELTRQDARHLLDADIEYRLSDTADEALRNGVPLAFELRLTVHDEPRRWWNRPVVDERRVFRVHYHSLAKLFQWTPDGGERPHGFANLGALLEDLGTLRRLQVAHADALIPGRRYQAELGVSLNIEALPLPLRPVAYLSPSWHLSSPAYTWPFVD